MLACLDRGSRTLRAVAQAGRFGINVLGAGDEELARGFASKAPHRREVGRGRAGASATGCRGSSTASIAWIACELRDVLAGGDHVIVTGAGRSLGVPRTATPLVFLDGGYRAARVSAERLRRGRAGRPGPAGRGALHLSTSSRRATCARIFSASRRSRPPRRIVL